MLNPYIESQRVLYTIVLLFTLFVGGGTYLFLVFKMQIIQEKELHLLPKGEKYVQFLKKLSLLK
jgi:hypothetical protein